MKPWKFGAIFHSNGSVPFIYHVPETTTTKNVRYLQFRSLNTGFPIWWHCLVKLLKLQEWESYLGCIPNLQGRARRVYSLTSLPVCCFCFLPVKKGMNAQSPATISCSCHVFPPNPQYGLCLCNCKLAQTLSSINKRKTKKCWGKKRGHSN